MKYIYYVGLSFLLLFTIGCNEQKESIEFTEALSLQPQDNMEFFLTNKRSSFYYGYTHCQYANVWQGWIIDKRTVFHDYQIRINNSPLERLNASVTFHPCLLNRAFPNGYSETLFLADSLALLMLDINANKKDTLSLVLEMPSNASISMADSYNLSFTFSDSDPEKSYNITSNAEIIDTSSAEEIIILTVLAHEKNRFVFSDNEVALNSLALDELDSMKVQKKKRLAVCPGDRNLTTNLPSLNNAFYWASASLDALINEYGVPGLYAGLPYFPNYWSRNTFASLKGALLFSGQFELAKEIMREFFSKQIINPSDPNFGKIPDLLQTDIYSYISIDAIPYSVIALQDYFDFTADTNFIKESYPFVKNAFDGMVSNNLDDYGFITHGEYETWMNARTLDKAWSPRDNRAVEVQALWYKQLQTTKRFAALMGDSLTLATAEKILDILPNNFRSRFIDKKNHRIADRLLPNNEPDFTYRSNLFEAMNVDGLITDYKLKLKILANAMHNLVYPHGVVSLSFYDDNFHPYHIYKPFYPNDASYNNGVIWNWNTSNVISTLCGFGFADSAYILTSNLIDQILNKGALGTMSSLTDAWHNREYELKESGAKNYSRSLAYFIQNLYEDYLGVYPDAPNKTLYLIPSLPFEFDDVEFTQKIGADEVYIKYLFTNDIHRINIQGVNIQDTLDIGAAIINRANTNYQLKTDIRQGETLIIEVPAYSDSKEALQVLRNNSVISVNSEMYIDPKENETLYQQIKFAQPDYSIDVPALQKPDYPLLSNKQIKHANPNAEVLVEKKDLAYDEIYKYPTGKHFVDGILDILHFRISEDSTHYYFDMQFRNLVNPKWHPGYGFQLTFATISFITDINRGRSRSVDYNAQYLLPKEREFNIEIVVGGGLSVHNYSDKILAQYFPLDTDASNPLGDSRKNSITFALEKKLIGIIDKKAPISVLVGAQDDHGGSGIGDFRNVESRASQYHGGGSEHRRDHNIYDFLFIH